VTVMIRGGGIRGALREANGALSRPRSYWSAADPDHLTSNDPKAFGQSELNLLQQVNTGI
jgi:hypothetical protein